MENRAVIITGGGTGIGRAAALQFAQAGAWVLVTGRRAGPLEETAGVSDRIEPLTADVLDETDIERVVQTAINHWGRIDVLVNNAGAFVQSPLDRIDRETVTSLFATNITAPTLLSRAALPSLKAAQGSIVNISSTFGHKAAPMISHYAASKAALEHLTRCWALELAPFGIRVNAVAPGPTETDILARSGMSVDAVEQIKKEEAGRVPLGRRGNPEEVASWVVRLAEPGAGWMTGQVISIDGGLGIA